MPILIIPLHATLQTSTSYVSFVKYLFKTVHHGDAVKLSGTDVTLDQI